MSWKEERIRELSNQLKAAGIIPPERIASEIQKIGFQCTRCGECCTGEENSVVVFPAAIRRIATQTGEPWPETVEPPSTGEWDLQGNFHTLEWRIKKRCGSCRYYEIDAGCRVYEVRPLICSTYPFYLEDGALLASECRGLGREIGTDDARELALRLIERYKTEIEEAIDLVKNYADFDRGEPSVEGLCIVHDSEGEHRISWTKELLRRCREGRE